MNSIQRVARSTSVLALLIAISFSQTTLGAPRRPAQRRARPEPRQASRNSRRAELRREAERRRAEAARLAAIARQRAAEEAMRDRVQLLIDKDDATGEDPEVRRIAINALGHHAGTVVVMDPATGRIYSVVNQQWALREGVKPCSTIKLVTGLAGLNENIINTSGLNAVSDSDKVDLTHALAYSKNPFFQQVGGQVGFTRMISYARQMGLGEKTGINVRNESQGSVPTFKTGFAVNHMSSHGDDFKVTAVQLATLVSAMANGGKLITPFIPHTPQDETRSAPKVRRLISIRAESFREMVPGMIGSVSYGSGRRAASPYETVVGKTGTCIDQGGWVGLFTSYAPLNNPRLAVVVIGRGADAHGHFPAAVAGRIYRDLGGRFGLPATQTMASAESKALRDEVLKISNSPAEKDLTADDEEADAKDDGAATSSATAKVEALKPSERAADSKLKRVLLPLSNPTAQTAKHGPTPVQPQSTGAQRPRRVSALP